MKAKRALQREIIHSIDHGNPQPRKLPETITLTRSQVYSLNALNGDEQRLLKQAQDTNAAIEATRKARLEVLNEIVVNQEVTLDDLSNYQFDGEKLICRTE